MIHYQENGFFLSSSHVKATFSDGVTQSLGHVLVESNTPMGDVFVFSSTQISKANDEETALDLQGNPYLVRLVLVTPDQDWRRNASYTWKLDNAWMSEDSSLVDHNWLHWNVQSDVDSIIRIPSNSGDENTTSSLFTCDQLEFHFRPILRQGGYTPAMPNTKLTLYNVEIGAHLKVDSTSSSYTKYSPCGPQTESCAVVDGAVTTRFMDQLPTSNLPLWEKASLAAALGLAVCILLAGCWRRWRRAQMYKQIHPTKDEDLTLEEEDTYTDAAPRLAALSVVNETG